MKSFITISATNMIGLQLVYRSCHAKYIQEMERIKNKICAEVKSSKKGEFRSSKYRNAWSWCNDDLETRKVACFVYFCVVCVTLLSVFTLL